MIENIVVGAVATNCWIVPLSPPAFERGTCVVIDPGGDAAAIIARLERRKLRPAFILLTHGHFDHVAALGDLTAAFSVRDGETDAGAPIVAIHATDAPYLGNGAYALHRRDFALVGAAEYVDRFMKPLPSPSRLLGDGDRIGPFRVLHVPGHTGGSVAFLDEALGVLFSGDTLFAGGVGRTDLPGGDGRALERSLERLLALPSSVIVHSGHGSDTRISAER